MWSPNPGILEYGTPTALSITDLELHHKTGHSNGAEGSSGSCVDSWALHFNRSIGKMDNIQKKMGDRGPHQRDITERTGDV